MDNELNRARRMATVMRVAIAGRVIRIQVCTMSELHISLSQRTWPGSLEQPVGNIGGPSVRDGRFSTGLVENLWTGTTPSPAPTLEW